MNVRKLTTVAISISLAVVLSIIESFIPTGIPGVKIGLANMVALVILYVYSPKEAILTQLLRIFLVGLIYSGILSQSFLLSLAGGLSSIIMMVILYLCKRFSIYLISITGAIFHSVGQILLSMIILKSLSVIYYLPFILIISIVCGFFTAFIAKLILHKFKITIIKTKPITYIISSVFLALSTLLLVLSLTYRKKDNEGSIAKLIYQNKEIMAINLKNPEKYENYGDNLVKVESDGTSYFFTFTVYNKEEKGEFYLTVEVKNEEIRISDETCKKHICSKRGFIKNKYESIICLPNEFIIEIEDYVLGEIDILM